MKNYFLVSFVVVIIVLLVFACNNKSKAEKYKALYEKELQNVDAYKADNSELSNKTLQYQMTIDDLLSSKDSTDKKIAEVVSELKIKEKNIEYLQYQLKQIQKKDTIVFKDTIFSKDINIDTIIGDSWYNLQLQLTYPSSIVTTPSFKSEQYTIINTKKEYNKTPSKIFFIRWFQKKHWVTEVNLEEKNPYIENKKSKFIKI